MVGPPFVAVPLAKPVPDIAKLATPAEPYFSTFLRLILLDIYENIQPYILHFTIYNKEFI